MSYEVISDGEIDGDSPGDTGLFSKIRDNIKGHTHSESEVVKISGQLGSWLSRSANTVYQAATDLIVIAYTVEDGYDYTVAGYTDASNPPTTLRAKATVNYLGEASSITFPVRKGDYWKVDNAAAVHEIAIGA